MTRLSLIPGFLALGLAANALADPAPPEKLPRDHVEEFVFLGEVRPVLVRLHIQMDGKPLQAASDELMMFLFRHLDVNGDGVLNKEEGERAPAADLLLGGGVGRSFGGSARSAPLVSLDALDADRNGQVTAAELGDYYRKNGLRPFQFQFDSGNPNPLGAAAAFLGAGRTEPSVEAISKATFSRLDTNSDGKLTHAELTAAPVILLQLDDDEDEMVAATELVTESNAGPGGLAAMMAMGGRAGSAAASHPTLVPILKPGEAPADLARRMHDRYGASLLPKNLGLDEAAFRPLDANGNGVLDDPELPAFIQRAPDLELAIRLGKKEPAQPLVELLTGQGRSPLASKVTLKDRLALLDLGLTRAEVRAEEERPDRIGDYLRQQAQGQFKQADADGNGFLDATEVQANRRLRGLFKALDRDGDGRVTEKELTAYSAFFQEAQQRTRAGCVTLELSDQSRGLFDLLDTNRDGRLSVRELRQAPKFLESLDRAGQGFLTRQDLPRSYRLALRQGPESPASRGAAALFQQYVSPGTAAASEPAGPGPLWFRKMDRNRDGDVSAREFLFASDFFRQIDADGDGLISPQEAEKAGTVGFNGK
jgi:Ca2+-binding EF-hand superfamily protein